MPTSRVQLALNVEDVTAATAFYSTLFGVSPHKQRDGYANFEIEDPPLKLVLIENPGAQESLNHIGVESPTSEDVSAALARFRDVGLTATVAEQDLCCHAVQDKVFVEAPDVPNGWWEFYAVTDDSPANPEGLTTSACEVACNGQDNAEQDGAEQDASAGSVCCG
ncbi:ArsI/CadI family heavy metal resistance metalloenzyme [Rhodococcus sp. NPDC003382]|uniref:ArsI/CadI family heavy metal resistance metalloenzyme n=1 Tax=Rhodococcus sp. HM1 TaxID=2937759 RepID=UPI00200B4E81|nr:ArsI/CadI family heavy metal resistance metalloenzyme [Rhodococcus sp. HM1]MCK8671140.1 VOC family protein [Rhodococcus sp. HM1]